MVWSTPFAPPTLAILHDPVAFREHLRRLYVRRPRLFTDWVRDAAERDLTLIGEELETAVLYDALCRVARSIGLDIGEPLVWTEPE